MKVYPILKSKFHFLAVVLCLILFSTAFIKAQTYINGVTSLTYIGGYHIKCNGQSTGSLKADPSFGTAPYTFLWSSGETTPQINNKPAGIYFVTMTDSLNNTDLDTFELKQPYPLDYEATLSDYFGYNIDAHGGHRGRIQLAAQGGTPPYRYLWNNGDSSVNRTGLTAGTYTFTITDANQCSANGSITLTEPNPIQASFSGIENPKCFKGGDGKATLNINGGLGDYSVVWDNGGFSLSPEDLSYGYNAVRIYEHGNAVLDTGITLTSPDEIDVQFTYTDYNGFNVSCIDCFNGSITTTITGGTAPYTFLWDDVNNSTSANLSNLNGGEYNLKIYDANGCKTGHTAQLTMPTAKDWSRHGNANIDTTEFIGSTDTSKVVFRTNNEEAMSLKNGKVIFKSKLILKNIDTSSVFTGGNKLIGIDEEGNLKAFIPGVILPAPPYDPANPLVLATCFDPFSVDGLVKIDGGTVYKINKEILNPNPCRYYDPTMYVGLYGCNGAIEVVQTEDDGIQPFVPNKLLINTLCGNDVSIGNNVSGNLIANYRIGIGMSDPKERLQVAGNAIVEGRLAVGAPNINNDFFAYNADYKLSVNGKIVATEILVKERTNWPDYVFKKDYQLKSIKEVNNFIKKHGHLPGAPTAKEVETNGINTGEMLNLQMQKIEELTLYIIDLQKQIDQLKQVKK